jgi:IS5 family transposase
MDLFALVPLTVRFDPELAQLDRLLDDDGVLREVRRDLARRHPRSQVTGRPSTPIEVIVRMLVVKHLYGWSYEETEHFVADSLVLRQFCRLYLAPAPDDTTLLRWANVIQPDTLHRVLDRVTTLALQVRVTRGRKLRTDSTVVETTIHYPTDSRLLADGVRVISRLVQRARTVLDAVTATGPALFRDRTRSAKRLAHQIAETTRLRGPRADGRPRRQRLYRRLLAIARASTRQAERVAQSLADQAGDAACRLRTELEQVQPLVAQVIAQTQRRVVRNEPVPAGEKLVSLFEPHSAVIRRGKLRTPAEFGRKLLLDEVEGGLVTRYALLTGNPPDAAQLLVSLAHHQERFGHAPDLLAGDRGFHSTANEQAAHEAGVTRVALPKPGVNGAERRTQERQGWFRRACRFRAGMEGRISVLKRRFGLDRCRYHGQAGMERWVGWGIITHNLRVISQHAARAAA